MEQGICDVSIIIPVYNVQAFFDKCICSVLEQTLQSIEIILVDDGSTDQSGILCDAYAARDERIKVIHIQNGGPARARNQGIQLARGKYIGFVDADDYVAPQMFECLYKLVEQTDSDIAICGYSIEIAGDVYPVKMDFVPLYSGKEEIKEQLIQRYYTGNNSGLYSMWNKLFRRSFLVSNNLKIDEALRRGEDAWFVFDCLKTADIVCYLPKELYFYCQNTMSIMHTLSLDQYEKWAYSRNRLLEENTHLNFRIDLDSFYRDFLYKTVNFCREMLRRNEFDFVKSIFEDPTFTRAIPYRRKLPSHVRLLLWLTQKKYYNTAIIAYRIWGLR